MIFIRLIVYYFIGLMELARNKKLSPVINFCRGKFHGISFYRLPFLLLCTKIRSRKLPLQVKVQLNQFIFCSTIAQVIC